jgi:hypothetical protein
VVFSHAPSLDRPNLQEKLAGPEGLAPSRSVLETNPSARTSRTYWCPRPVARRLPLFGRQPCICEHLSGESLVEQDGYAPSPPHCKCGVLLLSLRPQNGHDGGTCTRDPQLCRLVPWLLGHVVIENKTAAQVTRHRKTSPIAVLSDRGLKIGGAGGSCTRTVRIKSPLC